MEVPSDAPPGALALEACEYETKTARYRADCGTLVVRENPDQPTSRRIAIPVKRIRARSDSPLAPIFYLGGGPGMSNMGFKPPDSLLEQHDVVMVGYRGVDGSSVLDCPDSVVRGAKPVHACAGRSSSVS